MKKQLKIFSFLTVSASLLTGCVAPQTSMTPAPTTQLSCRLPQIAIIADTVNTPTQTKGGLDITITPVLYNAVRADKTTFMQVQPNFGEGLLMNLQTQVVVEQVTTPHLVAQPGRLEFNVKIHNQLNRVFHGQGAVAQINVDSKLFGNTDYKEFSGGIVPPLNENNFIVYGPPLDSLKDKGTMSIFLYDVVTATDEAGNIKDKQNYTWDFTYTMQTSTDTGEMKRSRQIMGVDQYQQMLMQMQQQQMQKQMQMQSQIQAQQQ
ncbi:MAG TPA: hypothetical protein VIK35_08295 [Verrucomicrobiae bacterium]